MRSQRLLLVIAIGLLVVANLYVSSPVGTVHAGRLTAAGILTFNEDFAWQGNHAATIKEGTATTVWWNEDNWDVRTDTAYNSVMVAGGSEHTDIHRSVPDLNSGVQDNAYVVGGDGSAGVGIMHLDFEAISSARLRNPMLISVDQPGVVEFRTTNFVTTGHWWELAITPAGPNDIIAGGEATAVPAPGTGAAGFANNPGPGSRPAEDSINFITIGNGDVPCITGWEFLNGVEKSVNGVDQEIVGPAIPTDPSEKDELYAWRLEYYPDKIVAFVDLDKDGTKELHATFNVTVPWDEVYVHLIAVAYQADHHPQGECFQGQVREIPWKDVSVWPVKYARTASHPKNEGTRQLPKETGWTGYDIRDTQRFGPTTDVPQQPNEGPYEQHGSFAFCNGGWFACNRTTASKTLTFDLLAADVTNVARAQLVYDVRWGEGSGGWGDLLVNGVDLGSMPGKETAPGLDEDTEWAQRSVDVPPSLLQPGQNTITVTLQSDVAFDRLHFELAYFDSDDTPPLAPTSLSAVPMSTSTISLSWEKATDAESGIEHYNIYRDGAMVATAFGTTWNDSGLQDAGTYAYEVSAVNGANLESVGRASASATTDADVAPPVLQEVTAAGASTQVIVVFSEAVDETSATNPANYSIDNGITVSAAALGSAPDKITLTTSDHSVGATYVLTVNNVLDRATTANAIAPNSQATFAFIPPGSGPQPPAPGNIEWLHVEGNKIVDELGNTVVLRGVNIENREWVWASTQSIDFERRAIPVVAGAPPAGWGANAILLAVASGPITRNDQAYVEALDELVALAKSYDAYTLLVYRYPEPNSNQIEMPDEAAENAMAALAMRYSNEPAVLYGLQVEPHDVTWSDLKPRFTTMIDAIQANNPNALIAVPGTGWSRYIDHALTDPILRDNLVYKTHPYDSWTNIENSYQLAEVAAQYPVLIGEFGPGDFMSLDDVNSLLNFAEVTGISWVGWLFHDVGCPCMLTDSTTFATTEYGDEIKARLQAAAKGEPLSYKVLVFHKTGSFVHTSTLLGVAAIDQLGVDNGFLVDDTVDGADFTDDNLAQYAAVVFLNTHQEVLDDAQQAAFERYIQAGGGYAGIHIASGTEYGWAWYGELVGTRFNFHPAIQEATVIIEDPTHPSTAPLPAQWVRSDEWYNFLPEVDRDIVHVLATVDESTYTGGDQGADHPIAWCQVFDGGRSWYTAMGHKDEHYSDPLFLSHLLGGIQYATGMVTADCSPSSQVPPPPPTTESDTLSDMTVATGKGYKALDGLASGTLMYIDRDYTYVSLPQDLSGSTYIMTANDDKRSATGVELMSFTLEVDAVVYVLYTSVNTTLEADWLTDANGWSDAGFTVETTLNESTREVREQAYSAGTRVSLHGNGGTSDATSMYNVVLVPGTFHPIMPGMSTRARDLDGDGHAEDTNGNGLFDFADIVLLFANLDSSVVQGNTTSFDYDGNGQVDSADVVEQFNLLTSGLQ